MPRGRALLRPARDFGIAIFATLTALEVAGTSFSRGFPVDDAWIHMVYGLALRTEGSLAYNDGAPATGCTSPLWAVVVALAHLGTGAHGPSLFTSHVLKAIGIALHATTAVLGARIVDVCARKEVRFPASTGAGIVVALAPIGAFSAVSGMEVSLASALLLATFLAVASRRPRIAGGALGLAIATRPEAVLAVPFVVVASVLIGIRTREPFGVRLRGTLRLLAVAILPPVFLLARNLRASGRPLPATFYQKARAPHVARLDVELRLVFDFMLDALPPYGSILLVALVVVALMLGVAAIVRLGRHRAAVRAWRSSVIAGAAAATGLAWLFAMAMTVPGVTPKAFYYQRYFAPALPLFLVAASLVAAHAARLRHGASRWERRAIAVAPVILFVARELTHLDDERARYASNVSDIDAVQVAMGALIATTPIHAVVWSQDAGAPRYFGRRKTVDLNRLNTPELLRTPGLGPELAPALVVVAPTVFEVSGAVEEVLARAPKDSNDRHARQVAFRCRPEGGNILVSFRHVRVAEGPCPR